MSDEISNKYIATTEKLKTASLLFDIQNMACSPLLVLRSPKYLLINRQHLQCKLKKMNIAAYHYAIEQFVIHIIQL